MRVLAMCLVLGVVGAARADAPPPTPRRPTTPSIAVSRIEGPRTLRAVHARLRGARVADCQHTWIGGDLIAEIEIDAAGALTVRALRSGEEVRSYGRCVERALGRIAFGPATGATRARVTVRFPPLGLP